MKKTIKYAFIQTMPIMFGYIFMGIAFGLLLQRAGYNFIWAFACSLFIYAGSMQFVLVSFLSGGVNLFYVIIMTLTINSRHIFYGLSFIEKFKAMGKRYPYMIFSLTDETYSILCGTKVPEGMNEKSLYFTMALLDQSYWITGCTLGGVLGSFITFNTKGIDFAMTALFVVIFVEQWLSYRTHLPAIIGLVCGIASLIIFGSGNFILPALIITVLILMVLKRVIESKTVTEVEADA